MFRRRPMRPRRPGGDAVAQLKRAHNLMDQSNYLQAAHLFEGLALGAVRRRIPRAPFLFIQAGRAFLYGGQHGKGTASIKRGLGMLVDAGRWGELYRVGHRLVDELQEKGFKAESSQLKDWLDSERAAEVKSKLQKKHPVLPTNCPNCGGIVNSQEVTWMDDFTAECLYCGSAIRVES
jgi:hypothetical protein